MQTQSASHQNSNSPNARLPNAMAQAVACVAPLKSRVLVTRCNRWLCCCNTVTKQMTIFHFSNEYGGHGNGINVIIHMEYFYCIPEMYCGALIWNCSVVRPWCILDSDTTTCGLVEVWLFRRNILPPSSGLFSTPRSPHSVTTQRTTSDVFTAMRAPNLMFCCVAHKMEFRAEIWVRKSTSDWLQAGHSGFDS
jgi:hypothetical protein